MSADSFYSDLPEFTEFEADSNLGDFRPVPDDWVVLATDIVQSRKAIEQGRYKEVNMVGAAVIAAVLNKLGRDRIPFVFGGDGALLVVPAHDIEAGREALAGVVDLARQVMELELRAAAIPVSHIRIQGGDIRIRKYSLSPGNHLAMVIGDGLWIADRILKDPEASKPFVVTAAGAELPPLDGLSCRWEPLPAKNGHIISLIMKPVGDTTLPDIMRGLAERLGYNPLVETEKTLMATQQRLKFRFPPRGMGLEIRLSHAGNRMKGWIKGMIENVAFLIGYSTGLPVGPFNPKKYFRELSLNTDHRKLGDSLQLVLDVSPQKLSDIKAFLEAAYRDRKLIYGLHISDTALMTCFVQDIGKSQHIHFVDGGGGGLSMAATEFKQRQEGLADELTQASMA
ncbi:MAG: DUF3095 family protein [Roseibium sp.]